jgi:hypothetical protein
MKTTRKIRHRIWFAAAALSCVVAVPVGISVSRSPSALPPTEDPLTTPDSQAVAQDERPTMSGGTRNAVRPLTQASDRIPSRQAGIGADSVGRARITANLERRNGASTSRPTPDDLSMPEWERIFLPGGNLRDDVNDKGMFGSNGIPDYVDLYNGIEAEFIQENLSNGVATDMSALLSGPKLSDEVLYNGAVSAEHDLGNAYVLATIGTDEHLRLYAGVERFVTVGGTYIEFEFIQTRVYLSSGSPWPLNGERSEGDVLVRMIFSDRMLQSVQVEQWHKDGFRFIDTGAGISGNTCLERKAFMYCVGPPPIRHPEEGFEVWDENNNVLDPVLADDFAQVGIDVDLLAGSRTHFTSVLFRTPEDIAMNSFQVFKHLAQVDKPSKARTGLNQ